MDALGSTLLTGIAILTVVTITLFAVYVLRQAVVTIIKVWRRGK